MRADAVANFLQQETGLMPERVRAADSISASSNPGSGNNVNARTVRVKLVIKRSAQAGYSYQNHHGYSVIPVFFATDRARAKNGLTEGWFGSQRGGSLSYGECDVSIPHDHRLGDLESPSWWRLEFSEDPEKHVVLLKATIRDKTSFYSSIAAAIQRSKGKSTFVFIHGYNVSFKEAARRTAQIAYDLGFDGAPVFYSWPSQGSLAGYTVDEQNIEWAQPNLQAFLADYAQRSGADNIFLIAHSMGSRALTRAVANVLSENPSLRHKIRQIILAAPDIDAEVFRRDIAPALTRSGRPVTLYASSADKAIEVSRTVHGNPRAGDSGDGLVIVKGVETIDATEVDTSFLGHSYIGERNMLSDIHELFQTGADADERFGLAGRNTDKGRYWYFKK
jgi:esterase/lipase superfamily enzyme